MIFVMIIFNLNLGFLITFQIFTHLKEPTLSVSFTRREQHTLYILISDKLLPVINCLNFYAQSSSLSSHIAND